ncbi:hypothetical protein ACWEPR_36310, partial [Streptomyces sp. NPDC004290]
RRGDDGGAAPAPPPPPSPSPTPTLRPRPATPSPVALPHYRQAARAQKKGGTSVVTATLMITAPAVLATAILRPRSK